jgi:hypothetical protein
VQEYVDTVIDFSERWFYFTERVDWPAVRARAMRSTMGAVEYRAAHPALNDMVKALNDRHSFFYVPARTPGTSNPAPEVAFHRVLGRSYSPRIGYVWVPTFTGTNQTGRADSIQKAIAKVDSTPNLCGWIVDLRGNPGGFWAPMLAGVSPLVPEGAVGGYVLRDKTQRYFYELHPGSAGVRTPTGEYFELSRLPSSYQVRNQNLPLAVLQGGLTASAGEILLMAFRDKHRITRTFGSDSYGATSQPFFKVLVDTASIQVTAGVFFDRYDGRFDNYLIPADQRVDGGPAMNTGYVPGTATDVVIDAATAWLRTQPPCTTPVSAALRAESPEGGKWQTPPNVRGARPVAEWPRGVPLPTKNGPPD